MKKTLLIILLISFFSLSYAQQRVHLDPGLTNIGVKAQHHESVEYVSPQKAYDSPVQTKFDVIEESVIGRTFYDLQSNSMLQNRIYAYPDATIGAVWTMGMQATSFPDRGAGYNYYDGSDWGAEPQERLESIRAGWPSYAPWGTGGEIVASHDFGASEIYLLTRETKGIGEWNEWVYDYTSGPSDLSWPRIMTSGEERDIVHLLANSVNEYIGQTSATVYSRSVDGGENWETENVVLDGMGSGSYTEISADDYVWAEPNGGAIAFLVASAWHDMFMMKSFDDGETWEKTVIWEHPYPFFEWEITITDTFFCVDNSASIALDSDGDAHVVFGINRVLHNEPGANYFLFPYVDGIGYWNEDMEPFSENLDALAPPDLGYEETEMIVDYNYIGWTQDYDGDGEITFVDDIMYYRELGVSTMPTIAIEESEDLIYVAWASTTETFDNIDFNFKKIWSRTKWPDGSWSVFEHLTENIIHIFDETIYPVLAPVGHGYQFDLIMNADGMPGIALDEEHEYVENRIIHLKVEPPPIGIDETLREIQVPQIMAAYPNPVKETLWLEIEMQEESLLEFTIADVTGRMIKKVNKGVTRAGKSIIQLDMTSLPKGLLFIKMKAWDIETTVKVLKQ